MAEFLQLLAESSISMIADVRRFPSSRHNPHFNRSQLRAALLDAGIAYGHFEALGGRLTERRPGSENTAWESEAFNAYADHMDTAAFQAALDALVADAAQDRTAVMCAEADPTHCHRRLLADALAARGWTVIHILDHGTTDRHVMPKFAVVADNHRVTYPGGTLF